MAAGISATLSTPLRCDDSLASNYAGTLVLTAARPHCKRSLLDGVLSQALRRLASQVAASTRDQLRHRLDGCRVAAEGIIHRLLKSNSYAPPIRYIEGRAALKTRFPHFRLPQRYHALPMIQDAVAEAPWSVAEWAVARRFVKLTFREPLYQSWC